MYTKFGADNSIDFLLESGQTDRQTDVIERPTHVSGVTAGVGNDKTNQMSHYTKQ